VTVAAAVDVLSVARALLARGLSVFPVPRPRRGAQPSEVGDGKTPAIGWRDYQTRLPTDAELVQWFSGATMNLAVVTGELSGVVVVDADSPEGLRWCTHHLPYTAWQTQTSRGFHLWYRHPGVRVPNRARIVTRDGRLAIDVRGDGGYVVSPGSVHASGAGYREGGDWTVSRDQLPRFWPGWLQRSSRASTSRPSSPRPSGDVVGRARRYLAAVPRPEIGRGSDNATLYVACRLVRGFHLSTADAEALLWEWAGGRPGWTRDWIARKVAHAERYGTEPIGALR
jgi:bifunctional DNA primase/polymerase-like protein